ncbi:hypothetical protein SAY86_031508 [Trapa natans]|uniref:SOSEKI DIX-like domain-containing protein n=1 Tax=Trapa natans TaxID=22666 RepID=A0AAN7M7Q5_TRANT|nr:hypothetical protein SAY86_031508 [Trapa natans]
MMEDMKMTDGCSHSTQIRHEHDHRQSRSGSVGDGCAPDRGSATRRPPPMAMAMATPKMKRAMVVYYLTRNGQLEHPHFMEVPHLPNFPLRLKDVMSRLTDLRGKGIPSMYSWSCKRSYKNGYVWNDLSDNDVILPVDGTEYVLKGSEIIVHNYSERFQQPIIRNRQINSHEAGQVSKRSARTTRSEHIEEDYTCRELEHESDGQEEYELDEEKTSYTSSTTPHSRCSRGVTTDELEEPHDVPEYESETQTETQQKKKENPCLEPPSSSHLSSTTSPILDQKSVTHSTDSSRDSRRFSNKDMVDSHVIPRFTLGTNSVLRQLISCGSMARAVPKSDCNSSDHRCDLLKGAVYKNAAKTTLVQDEATMILYMSENPRFGNLQSQEKEYFSGSIIDSIRDDHDGTITGPVLKKSNSYNEERERSSLVETGEAVVEGRKEKTAKSKCIPRMISSSKIIKKI